MDHSKTIELAELLVHYGHTSATTYAVWVLIGVCGFAGLGRVVDVEPLCTARTPLLHRYMVGLGFPRFLFGSELRTDLQSPAQK